ncbi:MAG: bifunctional diaminohydroxyphosphoribosylaminopyrimidine deaminase/5-amino-6-(5-phosphoribosylamino)uracil reductase RibD [Dehalococcoidia bacterium]|nr:bifunctional diaminohydroxyphosphoribosylaminopyrimidine deaminase/5-amino-6-(5-phosphoribosylamino)uracil reductase RibD [Dehalococcoidia bacterium]MDD5493060.1 bifunctional diaminohydroxyphosphoribosylaminopyrimidine deaminase/5-amino-6-(5-phosphoribosylamino)uracil reductase RibD [Dehalococcoidia bacterium]
MLSRPPDYMAYSLSLAELALGYTSPNPAVGAVVVRDGIVVGLGHTQQPGLEHAEVKALNQAGEMARGAAMYVTLEPCCHFGKTPPCIDAIINAGVSEVHIAVIDPNPMVAGKGIKALEEAGVKTYLGEYEQKAKEINEGYFKYITSGIPFVVAKFAMSIDGKIATKIGDSKWITSEEARNYAHGQRHVVDAIMVGANTIIMDDPKLTTRGYSGKGGRAKLQPLRVIVDGEGRVPPSSRIFSEPGKTLVAVSDKYVNRDKFSIKREGTEYVAVKSQNGLIDLKELLRLLGQRQITTVMIEGGSRLLGSFFDQHLVDKILAFIAPIIIGGQEAKTAVGGTGVEKVIDALHLHRIKIERFEDDLLISGYTAE